MDTKGMKVAAISRAGGCGKTTICKNMLAPLLQADEIVSVEHLNDSDCIPTLQIIADDFRGVAGKINTSPQSTFVLDIGSSNHAAMIEQLATYGSTREKINLWVIPALPDPKSAADALATVSDLLGIGVPAARIVFVLNNVTKPSRVYSDFAAIFEAADAAGIAVAKAVLASDIYKLIRGLNENVIDLASANIDFDELAAEAAARGAHDEVKTIGERWTLQDMAVMAARNLRSVFSSLPFDTAKQQFKSEGVAS